MLHLVGTTKLPFPSTNSTHITLVAPHRESKYARAYAHMHIPTFKANKNEKSLSHVVECLVGYDVGMSLSRPDDSRMHHSNSPKIHTCG